jgi:hypothetical protein
LGGECSPVFILARVADRRTGLQAG